MRSARANLNKALPMEACDLITLRNNVILSVDFASEVNGHAQDLFYRRYQS